MNKFEYNLVKPYGLINVTYRTFMTEGVGTIFNN